MALGPQRFETVVSQWETQLIRLRLRSLTRLVASHVEERKAPRDLASNLWPQNQNAKCTPVAAWI